MRKIILTVVILALTAGWIAGENQQETQKKQKSYMLVFDCIEYSPQLKEAVKHFFDTVLQPGDQLIIVTPGRMIGFSPQKLKTQKKELIPGILDQLKNDISMGSVKYRTTMEEMKRVVQQLSGASSSEGLGVKEILVTYTQHRQSLGILRQDLEGKLMKYVDIFRRVKGENHLLMFMEKEYRPIPDKKTMGRLREAPAISFSASEAFIEENYKPTISLDRLIAGFKYANVRFHFLYLEGKTARSRRGVDYLENSGDIYEIFTKLAKATGGIKLTSSKTSVFVDQVDQVVEGKVTVEVVDEKMEKEKEKEKN